MWLQGSIVNDLYADNTERQILILKLLSLVSSRPISSSLQSSQFSSFLSHDYTHLQKGLKAIHDWSIIINMLKIKILIVNAQNVSDRSITASLVAVKHVDFVRYLV